LWQQGVEAIVSTSSTKREHHPATTVLIRGYFHIDFFRGK